MIEVREVTADEMVLAFVMAEIDSPTERGQYFKNALGISLMDRGELLDRADLESTKQNEARRVILWSVREPLFRRLPSDTRWRLVRVTPVEVGRFKYVNHKEGWARVSGGFRLVEHGVRNLYEEQGSLVRTNVLAIAERVRRGDEFPPLIATQIDHESEVVLMEGHTRATAYVLAGLPSAIEVIIGSSAHMGSWLFF